MIRWEGLEKEEEEKEEERKEEKREEEEEEDEEKREEEEEEEEEEQKEEIWEKEDKWTTMLVTVGMRTLMKTWQKMKNIGLLHTLLHPSHRTCKS